MLNRGARRELIFLDAEDRQRLIATLAEACAKTGWQVLPLPDAQSFSSKMLQSSGRKNAVDIIKLIFMDQSRFIAKHVVNLPKSGIRDFFDIVAKMKDAISLGVGELVAPREQCFA